jgi:hypothetical protein
MKLLTIIFSLYILGLSVITCADAEQVSEEFIEYHQTNDDHDHNSEEDFCSPLCVCNCCRTNITITQLFSFVPELKVKKEFVDFYRVQQSGPVFSIWQPPKIA